MLFNRTKTTMIAPEEALPGRDRPAFPIPDRHAVLGTPIQPPFPAGLETAVFALGCFWGAERLFWQLDGVYTTAVGYAGGYTPHPTYEEVCTGRTGHAESVLVVFDPAKISYESLLRTFFEAHDPTQGMRQGNDVGTQYRSAIYYADERQRRLAEAARDAYQAALCQAGHRGEITTEIAPLGPFYYAEEYHQQYLHKVPNGYCGLAGTGVTCPLPAVTGGADDDGLKPLPSSEEEWRQRLTPEEYAVLRQAGTERPFSGEYTYTDEAGIYRCRACGNPLFSSETKYDAGCGWPSFTQVIAPAAVELREDRSYGMIRTEVRCARCHSHLGHVFDDGPIEAGGQRWCMNSVALELERR
ncbi:MAG: peptide-methionine (S)-S-oxide reductase MsrA [Sphaerobacter sp.]|nr:peptide-methionine (S)-S-oxide reductase MsrA [Sphaerobacter sp.]